MTEPRNRCLYFAPSLLKRGSPVLKFRNGFPGRPAVLLHCGARLISHRKQNPLNSYRKYYFMK